MIYTTYKRLVKNKYFQAILDESNPELIAVLRRDTLEYWHLISYSSRNKYLRKRVYPNADNVLDKKLLLSVTEELINQLPKPEDWQAPHRYCIAYYVRMVIKRDWFDRVAYHNKLTPRQMTRFINRLINHQYFLLKRLNTLSFEEKKQLLIFTDKEKQEGYDNSNNCYNFYAREYLYQRLFDKTGLEDLYKAYKEENDRMAKEAGLYDEEE